MSGEQVSYNKEYFKNRGAESKDYMQVETWIEYFKPVKVFDYGAGTGKFVECFNELAPEIIIDAYDPYGAEYSKRRVKKTMPKEGNTYDLVICYDVLEHLNTNGISKAINELNRVASKKLLVSVCMMGDPNFKRDPTHVTYRSRAWWVYQFIKVGFKEEKVPDYFPFRNQLLLFHK